MAYTTQYIGSRYVPTFANPEEWDSTRTYEPLTIVLNEGNSYTSRQFVPVGVQLTNTDYWLETGNYNAQVEQYRQEVRSYVNNITTLQNELGTTTYINLADKLQQGSSYEAQNNAILQTLINNAPSDSPIHIKVPANYYFYIGAITFNRSNIEVEGPGTINGSFINTPNSLTTNIKFHNITIEGNSNLNTDCFTFYRTTRFIVTDCIIRNFNRVFYIVPLNSAQNFSRVIINSNYFYSNNYVFYSVREPHFTQLLITADIHITNNIMEATNYEHIHAEGFDGGIIANNTMFFPSYMQQPANKLSNIDITYANWLIIDSNNLFEAGYEAIKLTYCQNVGITNNNIAWCGQRSQVAAINFNGSLNTSISISHIVGNNISQVCGEGIITENISTCIISGNTIFNGTLSTQGFYYGSDTFNPSQDSIISSVTVFGNNCNQTISIGDNQNFNNTNPIKKSTYTLAFTTDNTYQGWNCPVAYNRIVNIVPHANASITNLYYAVDTSSNYYSFHASITQDTTLTFDLLYV